MMEMGSKASINQGLLIDYLTKIKTKGLTIKGFFFCTQTDFNRSKVYTK